MMREVVKISSKAIVIPFSLAVLIPHFFQLTLMWLESPFRLPGCSKQELGQTQHQKAAEPAGGKIKPILQGNYWTLSASWRKCTGDFSMSAGAQMLGHMTKDMYLSELQPATTQYIHRLVLSWVSESTHFEKFIKHKSTALMLTSTTTTCHVHSNKTMHRSLSWHWLVFSVPQLLDLPPPHWKDLTVSLPRCSDT